VFVILAAIVVVTTTAGAVVLYIFPTTPNQNDNTETPQVTIPETNNGTGKEVNIKTSLMIIEDENQAPK